MSAQYTDTVQAILEAGRKEFLTYGYEKASLRRIAAAASVTTGAIYGYFSGKEALFDALTREAADELVRRYTSVHEEFAALPPEQQPGELMTITDTHIPWMVNYIYDHFTEFKLLLCCNTAGGCERFFERLAKVEEQSCWDLIEAMRSIGRQVPELNDSMIHILCRSFFQQLQEFVFHDVPREEAVKCAMLLGKFRHAGWLYLLNL